MASRIQKQWLLLVFIVFAVLCLAFIGSKVGLPQAAKAQLQTGTDYGILVVPVQIERDIYGLAMVNTVGQTLWVYELNSRGPAHNRLKLLAARSWRYDKLLHQYNTAEPKPEQVKMLLKSLGQHLKQNKKKQQHSDIISQSAEPNIADLKN